MRLLPGSPILATGDDSGTVKVWDLRQRTTVCEFTQHTDYISDMTCVPHKKTFLVSSGDGTISYLDWRKVTRKASYELEDEPLSIVVMKNNTKVVCGTQEGTLAFYSVGERRRRRRRRRRRGRKEGRC